MEADSNLATFAVDQLHKFEIQHREPDHTSEVHRAFTFTTASARGSHRAAAAAPIHIPWSIVPSKNTTSQAAVACTSAAVRNSSLLF